MFVKKSLYTLEVQSNKHKMNTEINLTELEKQVLEVIANGDEFDNMPTQCLVNIQEETEIPTKILRGVLSSLEQKNAIVVGWFDEKRKCFSIPQ